MLHDTHPENLQSSPASEGGSDARWPAMILPGVAVLVTLALFAYAIVTGSKPDQGPALAASNATKTASRGGDFAPQAGWVENLSAELSLAGQGQAQLPSAGPSFADLPLSSGLPAIAAAELTNTGPADIRLALAAPPEGQKSGEEAAGLQEARLDTLSIEFPSNSARISRRELATIRRAAGIIKALPEGTRVELVGNIAGNIAGHSVSRNGVALAKRRAEAVYKALVREKVNAARLSMVVSGPEQEAQAEGRSSTVGGRRVEFRIVGPNVPWHKA